MNLLHLARTIYRTHRRALHRRLVARFRRQHRSFLRMPVDRAPEMQFDERSSLDRFRRESGQR